MANNTPTCPCCEPKAGVRFSTLLLIATLLVLLVLAVT